MPQWRELLKSSLDVLTHEWLFVRWQQKYKRTFDAVSIFFTGWRERLKIQITYYSLILKSVLVGTTPLPIHASTGVAFQAVDKTTWLLHVLDSTNNPSWKIKGKWTKAFGDTSALKVVETDKWMLELKLQVNLTLLPVKHGRITEVPAWSTTHRRHYTGLVQCGLGSSRRRSSADQTVCWNMECYLSGGEERGVWGWEIQARYSRAHFNTSLVLKPIL